MKPEAAKSELERSLAQLTLDCGRLLPEDGIRAMLAFYKNERADGCKLDASGDMLLYQWGTYDWGAGEFFELDITRQFCASGEDEDFWQLSLTFKYVPTASLRALRSGDRWCQNLEELRDFDAFVRASEAHQAVATIRPAAVELDYECVE